MEDDSEQQLGQAPPDTGSLPPEGDDPSPTEVIEEHDGNTPTGVELEREQSPDEDFEDIDRPWNPESIRVATKTFSLRNMLDAIEEQSLDLAPDFQRLHVWRPVQKAQLIESILLQIPLPAFYFAEDLDGTLRVVDGVQRLSTIYDFVKGGPNNRGGFALTGLEYIADVWGKRFSDLPAQWRRRLYNTQIVANVIDPTTPQPVMYDIFRRINTGGTPLNAQEIRHCMSKPRSRAFLAGLIGLPEFEVATTGLLKKQRRMIDREVALRFCAFYFEGPDRYGKGTMEQFLWRVTERLDDPDQLSDDQLSEASEAFSRGLRNSHAVFGEFAFRKWPAGHDSRNPFNRALFETWTVELSRLSEDDAKTIASQLCRLARGAMATDDEYISSITAGTGAPARVALRFARTRKLLTDCRS